ncbi:MAG: hypothetical protein ACP5QS_06480, partial [bacterium]
MFLRHYEERSEASLRESLASLGAPSRKGDYENSTLLRVSEAISLDRKANYITQLYISFPPHPKSAIIRKNCKINGHFMFRFALLITICLFSFGAEDWKVLFGKTDFINNDIYLDNAVILWGKPVPEDFVLDVKVKIIEKRQNAEACILIGAVKDASRFFQIYIDQPSNSLRAIAIGNGKFSSPEIANIPFKIEMGKWYDLRVIHHRREILVYLNGKRYLYLGNIKLEGKKVGLRVGDGKSAFSSFSLRPLNLEKEYELNGEKLRVEVPLLVQPLESFKIKIRHRGEKPLNFILCDANGFEYLRGTLRKGINDLNIRAFGALGTHKLKIKDKRGKVIEVPFEVDANSQIETESGLWDQLFSNLRETIKKDRFLFTIDGKTVAMNPSWLRDHIHEMKGYKWWEEDVRSALDHFLKIQHPEGFFYEMIIPPNDPHTTFVDSKYRIIDEKNNLAYVRLEMEADIEYLMVEGVYQAWQATGDDEWLRSALPKLIKGMEYCMSSPKRWDERYQLVKRTFSIDTWDFTYGVPANNRRIEEGMPMSIMHGDNSGMFYASVLLSRMLEALGERNEAERWKEIARHFKETTNQVCWNGKFYTHQIHINHEGAPGVDEREILSLSNAYDINRGLPDHSQAISIIKEYQRRREATRGEYFAEWFSVHPPYPLFKAHEWMKPGTYINGGIAGFVAGELAKAALWQGEESYGIDILRRVAEKVKEDGEIAFLYTPEGKDQGGGPKGWSAAAVISALIEGLAGIRDDGKLLR